MKKILSLLFLTLALACSSDEGTSLSSPSSSSSGNSSSERCYYNGHLLHTGPQGGCYYINSNGNKVYVDREHCNC